MASVNNLTGSIVALVTPFKENGDIDFDALDRIVDFNLENGTDGILVLGTTGESSTMTDAEDVAVAQHVVNASAGLISGSTAVDASTLDSIRDTLEAMEVGPLLGLFLQSFIVQVCSSILSVAIFVIVYGRMMEIYLMTSLAPIPFSTFGNREQSHIGQNYLRALFALGFQGFLIMICIGIYAVLVQTVAFTDNIIGSIWGVMGYTVLLCFALFKTGSLAKSVMSAH